MSAFQPIHTEKSNQAVFRAHPDSLLRILMILMILVSLVGANTRAARAEAVCTDVSLIVSADTFMNSGNTKGRHNFGGSETIQLNPYYQQGGTDQYRAALLKWDLASIPSDATVTAASLRFYVITGQTDYSYSLYSLRRAWIEGSNDGATGSGASWNYYGAGEGSWGTSGAANTSSDRYNTNLWDAAASDFGPTGEQTFPLNADGLAVVQGWIADSSTNFGLTIQNYTGDSTGNWVAASRENSSGYTKPALNLTYCLEPAGPTIVTSGSLAAFSAEPGTPSAAQTYTVTGASLTANIAISAPDGFEISSDGSNYSSSLILVQSGGSVPATTIFVRLNSDAEGTFSGVISHTSSGATTQNVAVSGSAAAPLESWTAYNDSAWASGQIDDNITTYTIPDEGEATGPLVDYASGTELPVTAAFSASGGPGLNTTSGYDGSETAAGTDAYSIFHGKADMAGVIQYGDSGWWVDVTFSGLDPAKTYAFATSANRDGDYTDRITRFTLLDATTATNTSSSGVTKKTTNFTEDTVAFNTGNNTATGYVASWSGIQPGADGDFTVRAEADTSERRAYAFSVFMLQQESTDPIIHISGTPLNAFSSQPGVPSAEQSYTVAGSNLMGNIIVSAPADFEISKTSGSGFSSSLTLAQSGGSVAATPVYVRFNRAALGASSGNISHTSSGATTRNVAVSGEAANLLTLSFQNGVSGYSGTKDTFLRGSTEGNTNFGSDPALEWDENSGTTTDEITLIRFEDLFSSEGGPIPDGAEILSASLSYRVTDASSSTTAEGDPASVYESLVDWDEASVTYNNFGGDAGVQSDEYQNLIGTALAEARLTTHTLDVTESLQRWSADPGANKGWIFLPTGDDGVTVFSSDHGTAANRPLLSVTFATGPINHAPGMPVPVQPGEGTSGVSTSPVLQVTVTDPDGDPMNVSFYGRAAGGSTGEDFTLVAIPDTQMASQSYPQVYSAMTQWIADNQTAENIAFTTHLGDIVNIANNTTQWENADAAMDLLDAGGAAYSVGPGNHDMGTGSLYNTYFGTSRFSGKPWYGGNYGSDNYNNYSLFSAGGMDFILINLQYNPTTDHLNWADGLLKANASRQGIVVSHNILNVNNSWSNEGIFTALKDNPNLFLMLCGHMHSSSDGAAYREEKGDDGHTIHVMLADYQDYPSGGSGYLRLLRFSPAEDMIYASTYSPYLDEFITTSPNQMEMAYEMDGGEPFELIGTDNGVASGATASLTWSGLSADSEYEWYVVVSDGDKSTNGPTWSFSTAQAAPACYALSLTHTGQGSDPVAAPAKSAVCSSNGRYVAGESISLSGAVPEAGWQISGWTGTAQDGSTASTNTLTMPASAYTVSVHYADLTPPETTITAQPEDPSSSAAASFQFSSSESGSTFECKLDAGDYTACTSPKTYSDLSEGSHTFQVRATDAQGNTDPTPAIFTWVVEAVNHPPVITEGDTAEVVMSEDGKPTAFSLTLHATDEDGNTLTWSILTQASHGTASASGTGASNAIIYNPTTDYNGSDSFAVQVSDGLGGTDTITVNVTVQAVNDPPVADAQSVTTAEDSAKDISLTGSDVEDDPLTYSVVSEPSHGSLTGSAPNLTYTPDDDYNGPDSFTFRVNDGTADSSDAVVSINVTPVNDAPVLDSIGDQSVNELSALSFTAAASDVDGDSLTFSLDAGAPEGTTIAPASGIFSWTPTEAQGPDTYTITIRVSDGTASDSETFTIEVAEVNAAPVLKAIGDRNAYAGLLLSFTAGATDSDLPANTLTYSLGAGAPQGAAIDPSSGQFTWTPTAAQCPGSYTVTIRVSDGTASDSETFTIFAEEVDIAPAAEDLAVETDEETPLNGQVVATDADGDALTFERVSGPEHGELTFVSSGAFTYTPEANFHGSDSFTYRANDSFLDSNTATVSITVRPVNDAPVAVEDAGYVVEEGKELEVPATAGVLANDSDVDGDALSAVLVAPPEKGELRLNKNGSFSYTPEPGFEGLITFTYKAFDGLEYSPETRVEIAVVGIPVTGPTPVYLPMVMR